MLIALPSSLVLLAGLFVASVQAQEPADAVKTCSNGRIALTFDDGPTAYTRQIIDQLVAKKQHATFFVNVNNYDCNYKQEYVDVLRYAFANKMTLASHTAGHPHLPALTDDQIRFQIRETNKFLNRTLGVTPKFIRIPYGETNDRVERIVKEFGMTSIWWSIDTSDSLGASPDDQVAVFNPLQQGSNDIIIMHDTHEEFAKSTFGRILDLLAQKGIKSSGMGRCLGHHNRRDSYIYYNPREKQRKPNWNCDNIPIGNPPA